ncbi:MAG: DNA adenine methylase [Candidatus Helarchaeota archaeon]
MIKSPLRYPGGKSRAIKYILPLIPKFKEFREPFVGGGSVFIAVKQQLNPNATYRINDLNYDLFCFWKVAKEDCSNLVNEVFKIKNEFKDGKELYYYFIENEFETEFEKAIRFFILNRITFSGTVDSGGYSKQSFEKRFTKSSIVRLKSIQLILENVFITNYTYTKIIEKDGDDVFIFCDPPYLKTIKSRLYGKKGYLHLQFNHEEFAMNMKKCPHKWLITLDDSPKIRELFSGFANFYEWELQYGMNNYKQSYAKKGKELFITNYEPSFKKCKNIIIDTFV